MLPILALATLVSFTPTITFTSDSVYKNENVLIIELQEDKQFNYDEETQTYYTDLHQNLHLKQKEMLGYEIYDNPDTNYIDGLKFDGEFVTDWIIKDYDASVQHSFIIKTVYTDDVAGMFAAAKDGNWSIALSNPLILIQLFYYVLAAFSLILGGFGLFKSKGKKVKTANEIADTTSKVVKDKVIEILDPIVNTIKSQNQHIIEAFILSQSGGKDSRLALIDLLKTTATEDVALISDAAIKSVNEASELKEKAKAEADEAVRKIAEGFDDKNVRF